ncbi:MAG: hypothetical protein QXF61_05625 [Nitrososphaeria archaeon]
MNAQTVQKAYHLSRPCFELNPFEDAVVYFGREDLLQKLLNYVKMSSRQQKPLKLVLEGSWGFGKTHTLMHITVNQNFKDYMDCVYVLLPDLSGKESSFDGFFKHVIRALLKSGILKKLSRDVKSDRHLANELKETAGTFVYNAIFGLTDIDTGEIAERWLLGETLTKAERTPTGLSSNINSDEARDLLSAIGRYYTTKNGKMLTLLLDEAHRMQNITEDSPNIHDWSTHFKILLDATQCKLGLIFAMGERERPVTLLERPEDRSRLGYRWEVLPPLEGPTLETFLQNLIRYVRDGWNVSKNAPNDPNDLVIAAIKKWNSEHPTEPTDEQCYPFTINAFKKLITNIKRAAPRDICKAIDDVAAYDQCVDRGIITEADTTRIIEITRELEKVRRGS